MSFNEKLSKALEDSARERMEEMCRVEKKHRFSLAYRLWECRTLAALGGGQQKVSLHRLRYMLAAIMTAALLIIGAAVSAVIVLNTRYELEDKQDYSKFFIEKLHSDKGIIEEYYGFPEEGGWQIKEAYVYEQFTMITYENNEEIIVFGQSVILDGYMGNVNTENAEVELISLYEENDGLFIVNRDGVYFVWTYDGYLFDIRGNFTKKEAIDLAYFIKNVDFEKFL